MKKSPIIIIINKKPYTLYLDDEKSIRSLPKIDRQQLITLLEAVKRLEEPVQSVREPIATKVNVSTQADNIASVPGNLNVKSAGMGSGDADALMAQLIIQEELNKKPEITKQTIHKWVAGSAIAIILLILIFS